MAKLEEIVGRLEGTLGPLDGPPAALDGGITNRNYRVSFAGRDCVLRLPGAGAELLGISRDAELIATEAAAGLGIAPALLAAEEGCLVTAFLSDGPLEPGSVRARLQELGSALRRFHDCGARLPVSFWVPDLLDSYAALISEHGHELPDAYHRAIELADEIAQALPLQDPVPCHNDLLAANLMPGGEYGVMLIDWEYAGMGHRLFDLGNLAVNNDLDEADEERLLGAYLGRAAKDAERSGLRLMRILSDAREAAWGVVQSVISELDFDFAGYAEHHFERLDAAAGDPRLREWLHAAAP